MFNPLKEVGERVVTVNHVLGGLVDSGVTTNTPHRILRKAYSE